MQSMVPARLGTRHLFDSTILNLIRQTPSTRTQLKVGPSSSQDEPVDRRKRSRREYHGHHHPRLSSINSLIASYRRIAPHDRLRAAQHDYHSSSSTSVPILPAFEKFEAPQPTRDRSQDLSPHLDRPSTCLIILHGLFGSKQNWRSLAKKLSQATQQTVFTLDLRNHGQSPSTPGFTSYLDYASDVKNFITSLKLQNVSLMGHSMGGKVAMTVALEASNSSQHIEPNGSSSPIRKLIVVDISPAKGFISDSFKVYLDGFREINSSSVSSRKHADEILSKYEDDISVRQFLLTNLKKVELQDGGEGAKYEIRLPIEVLQQQISTNQIGDFPFVPNVPPTSSSPEHLTTTAPVPFKNPTLFIKGAKSKYINKYNIPAIDALFKDFEIITLDTGHWVHAERPHEFIESVAKFLND